MNRHVFRYYFTEGFRGVFLHAFSSFAAVGVITACLLIMGSFTLVAANVQSMVTEMEQNAEIVITVDESLTEAKAKEIGTRISEIDNVMQSVWFSSEMAFRDWEAKNDPIATKDLPEDIFPHRYRIFLVDVQFAEETADLLRSIPGIAKGEDGKPMVQVQREILELLLDIRRVVQTVSMALIVSLLVVSLFIMQNTIKLATFERREEIAIMRVVGASKGFIRNPFIVEGFILGISAGLCAYLVQMIAYNRFEKIIDIDIITPVPFAELWMYVLAAFLATGFFVGVFGSLMTIRKYLKA
jgi:cell division transport system permease protein